MLLPQLVPLLVLRLQTPKVLPKQLLVLPMMHQWRIQPPIAKQPSLALPTRQPPMLHLLPKARLAQVIFLPLKVMRQQLFLQNQQPVLPHKL